MKRFLKAVVFYVACGCGCLALMFGSLIFVDFDTVDAGLYPVDVESAAGWTGDGQIFVVDPVSGNDNYSGQKWSKPLASLAQANSYCVASRGDIIFRLPGTETVSGPVVFAKSGITVVAVRYEGGHLSIPTDQVSFATNAAAGYTNGPVIKVTAPVRLIGLQFDGRNTSGPSVLVNGEGGGSLGARSSFEGCRFPKALGAIYGIEFSAGIDNRVENCIFDGAFTAGIFMDASASNEPTKNSVTGCVFMNGTSGIVHDTGAICADYIYSYNVFFDMTTPIDFNAQASNGVVIGNWFPDDANSTAYDEIVATVAADGVGFAGNRYAEVP